MTCGVAYPLFCDENMYMFLASSLLRPHLAYRIQRSKMDKDAALTNEILDSYLKDVFKSTLFFLFACPIMVYKIYIKKDEVFQEDSATNQQHSQG